MQLKTDLYIDGKWVKGSGTHPVYDPSDNSVIAEIQIAGEKECDAAVDAAYRVLADPLLIAGKAKRLYDLRHYSLNVILGDKTGAAAAEYFAKIDGLRKLHVTDYCSEFKDING